MYVPTMYNNLKMMMMNNLTNRKNSNEIIKNNDKTMKKQMKIHENKFIDDYHDDDNADDDNNNDNESIIMIDIVTDCDIINNHHNDKNNYCNNCHNEINSNSIDNKNNNNNNNYENYTKDNNFIEENIEMIKIKSKSLSSIIDNTSSNCTGTGYNHNNATNSDDCNNGMDNEDNYDDDGDHGYNNNNSNSINTKNNINDDDDSRMDMIKEYNLDESSQRNKMKIALGVLIRLVLPLCNGVARGLRGIRGVRLLKILTNLGASRHMLANMLAYAANTVSLGLSSVQVVYRIDPILKIMKLKKGSSNSNCLTSLQSSSPSASSSPSLSLSLLSSKYQIPIINPTKLINLESLHVNEITEKCVTLDILAEPPSGQSIRADIIFIHGLHGSLINTWKQGLWNSEGKKEEFKRPPKPPLRPPKRPRHSRSSIIIPPHVKKRPRYVENDDGGSVYDSYDSDSSDQKILPNIKTRHFSYDCGQPEIIDFCNDVEYSFPTFRLRREDSTVSTSSTSSSISSTSVPESTSQYTNADSDSTATNNNSNINTDLYSKCWPGDWLPLDCPGVRVIALNYTTDPYLWRPIWVRKRNRTSLTERAREMTDMLIEKRVGHGHPIVWVGHSKGGIFIKQIIVDAWESGRLAAAPLWRSSRGVFFYSVPHRGSPLADFNLPLLRRSIELTEIQKNSPSILDLHRRFVALYHSGNLKIDVFSFVETALTLMSVLYLRIVGVDSADPGIGEVCGVHLDHREICKPRSRNCILYTELVKMINRIS